VTADDTVGSLREAAKMTGQLALWTVAWVATLALARFGPAHLWDFKVTASWVAVAANLAVGVGWIVAHARYIRKIDELQRKIMQDALAVTLGVGWVGGLAYVATDAADLIANEVSIGTFAASLAVVYMVAIVVGHFRYR